MKTFATMIILFMGLQATAGTFCTDTKSETKIARDAVKAIVALSDSPKALEYWGGVQNDASDDNVLVVNVQPHFENYKDWYKVSVRSSDCQVLKLDLFRENLAL